MWYGKGKKLGYDKEKDYLEVLFERKKGILLEDRKR